MRKHVRQLNQSDHQSNNQSINHSTDQSVNHSLFQPINQLITQSLNYSMDHPIQSNEIKQLHSVCVRNLTIPSHPARRCKKKKTNCQSARAARAVFQRDQRRRARGQQAGVPGVHDSAHRRRDLLGVHVHRMRGWLCCSFLPCIAERTRHNVRNTVIRPQYGSVSLVLFLFWFVLLLFDNTRQVMEICWFLVYIKETGI